jgi:hypothetical protein
METYLFKKYGLLILIAVLLILCIVLDKWLSVKNTVLDKTADAKFFSPLTSSQERSIGIASRDVDEITKYMKLIAWVMILAIIIIICVIALKLNFRIVNENILFAESFILIALICCISLSFFGIYKPYQDKTIDRGVLQVNYKASFWLYVAAFVLVIAEMVLVYNS